MGVHDSIRLLPEYQGNLLLHFDPKATESDSDALQKALAAKLPQGLTILPPSAAEDADVFTVTKETATEYGLTTLADLAKHNGKLVFGGPPRTRPGRSAWSAWSASRRSTVSSSRRSNPSTPADRW